MKIDFSEDELSTIKQALKEMEQLAKLKKYNLSAMVESYKRSVLDKINKLEIGDLY